MRYVHIASIVRELRPFKTVQDFVDISKSWKWAGPSYAKTMDGEYPAPEEGDWDAPGDHGTGILSKLAGKTLGVVKNSLVVVVRAPPKGTWDMIAWLQQSNWILENWGNVREDGRHPVGITCIAAAILEESALETASETAEDEKALADLADRLNKASSEGLLVINSSGNKGGVSCAQVLRAHVRHCD